MHEAGTWLCPTAFDRARLLDMESRLAPARAIMYGSLAVGFAIGVPWFGFWILIPLAASVIGYAILAPRIERSRRPEYVIAATVVNAQVLIGVGIAVTGGASSPAIPILLLPIITLPARFPARGVAAGIALTVAVLLLSTVVVDPAGFIDDPTYTVIALAILPGLAGFAHALMSSEMEQRADAILDPLTGLLNRKALQIRFAELASQAAITDAWISVIECDLDHFKRVNDLHGHDRGDAVLKDAAYVLRRHLRSFELVYRLGGEEFLVVLPGLTPVDAADLAERLREGVEEARPGGLPVTASFGVAGARGDEVEFESIFRAADEALYSAKNHGRNLVETASDAPARAAETNGDPRLAVPITRR